MSSAVKSVGVMHSGMKLHARECDDICNVQMLKCSSRSIHAALCWVIMTLLTTVEYAAHAKKTWQLLHRLADAQTG